MKRILPFLGSGLLLAQSAYSAVTLTCDFSDPDNERPDIYNFWNAHNRLPPFTGINKPAVTEGAGINCVRMLGGWPDYTVIDGTNSLNTSILANDCYQWNGSTYVYSWGPLTNRINVVLNSGMALYQLVLDNPPWAFQHGLQFVAVRDGVHYLAADQYAQYGNAVPPNDPVAWANFIKAMLTQLTNTYGAALVSQWRFRVGSEIDTSPGHWVGTEQDFLNHYSNTVTAVRAILPNAKVGAHFLSATKSPKYVNYTGTTNAGFGVGFVRFCYTNNLAYDFVGVSAYSRYDSSSAVNMDTFYANTFSPINDDPQFNTNATMEIHEYNCRTSDGLLVGVTTSHDAAYFAMLGRMFYEKGLTKIQQWGNQSGGLFNPRVLAQAALSTMVGRKRYANTASGSPAVSGNIINGVFASDAPKNQYDALIFNYNVSPTYRPAESVNLALTVPLPAGSACEYRYAIYSSNECAAQKFVADYPLAGLWENQGGWVVNGMDKNGSLNDILNSTGLSVWNANDQNYTQYNNLQWSAWAPITTAAGSNGTNSTLSLTTTLPSFAFQKFEFRLRALTPPWESADIGSPLPGFASATGGVFTVQGSGADIWSTNDQFQYVHQPAIGDCEIVARVASLASITVKPTWPIQRREPRDWRTTSATRVRRRASTPTVLAAARRWPVI